MSLIVARKDKNGIYIVSDTKLSYPNNLDSSLRQKTNPTDGIIKTTIINNTCCVSFAGNIEYADDALKRINNTDESATIIKILLEENQRSGFSTDFICCTAETEFKIFKIRNGQVASCESAWIGSLSAFQSFQQAMLGDSETELNVGFISIVNSKGGDLFSKMSKAIDYVIQNEDISEVAGFKVRVCYDNQKFNYIGYFNSYLSNQQLTFVVPPGADRFSVPITHGTAASGGYTVNFFDSESADYTGLHILQGNFGIVFTRIKGGLLYPSVFPNMDELDFVDEVVYRYKMRPTGTTQNAIKKYASAADLSFKEENFEKARDLYAKGLNHLHGKEKARFYYNRALCQIRLNRISDAISDFNEAIKLDSSLQNQASSIMQIIFSRK